MPSAQANPKQSVPMPQLKQAFGDRCVIRAKTVDASTLVVPELLRDNGSVVLEIIEIDGKKQAKPLYFHWQPAFGVKDAPKPSFHEGLIELEGFEGGVFDGIPSWIPAGSKESPPPSGLRNHLYWRPIFHSVRLVKLRGEQAAPGQPATRPLSK
jgi:hypothetical protein